MTVSVLVGTFVMGHSNGHKKFIKVSLVPRFVSVPPRFVSLVPRFVSVPPRFVSVSQIRPLESIGCTVWKQNHEIRIY